ncbi:MAG: T9SS type A sorting domain-containing protein, partial [Chitinophagales bacterium]|nr:T9SS type A sorting domain-containing protein [Chitinophagales bacterium]
ATQQFSDITASVYDIYGRLIFEQKSADAEFQLITSVFESGNYLLHISMDGKFAVRKFMIAR